MKTKKHMQIIIAHHEKKLKKQKTQLNNLTLENKKLVRRLGNGRSEVDDLVHNLKCESEARLNLKQDNERLVESTGILKKTIKAKSAYIVTCERQIYDLTVEAKELNALVANYKRMASDRATLLCGLRADVKRLSKDKKVDTSVNFSSINKIHTKGSTPYDAELIINDVGFVWKVIPTSKSYAYQQVGLVYKVGADNTMCVAPDLEGELILASERYAIEVGQLPDSWFTAELN